MFDVREGRLALCELVADFSLPGYAVTAFLASLHGTVLLIDLAGGSLLARDCSDVGC